MVSNRHQGSFIKDVIGGAGDREAGPTRASSFPPVHLLLKTNQSKLRILEKEGESPHVFVRFPLSIFEDRYMGSHPNVPVKSARVVKNHEKTRAKLWITEKNAPRR